jgi:hypothetical protein
VTEASLSLPIALRETLEQSEPDLLRSLLQSVVEQLMRYPHPVCK